MNATVKWVIAALAAAVLLVGAGWLLAYEQGKASAAQARTSADSALRMRDNVIQAKNSEISIHDSAAKAAAARADTLDRRRRADSVARVTAERSVMLASMRLADAIEAADSLHVYRDQLVPALLADTTALHVELARSDSTGLSWRDAFRHQLEMSGSLRAIIDQDSLKIVELRAELFKVAAVPSIATSLWPRIGRTVETGAIGLTTLAACKAHVLSIGCAAGAIVTARRIF